MINMSFAALANREKPTNSQTYSAPKSGQAMAVSNDSTHTDSGVILTLSNQAISSMTVRNLASISSSSILKVGSRGTAVKELQKNLTKLGYDTKGTDGIFGNDTKNAVLSFQRAFSLTSDGIVGTTTQSAIAKSLNYHNKGILVVGSRGAAVTELQKNLTKLGYDTKGTDGIFGTGTKKAVEDFQKAKGLNSDGIVGTITKTAILDALIKLADMVKEKITPGESTTPTTSRIPQFQGHNDLGYLSSKFEAHGECGTISTGFGDSGGKSYGLYQFASRYDVPMDFVN